MPNWKKVIVSGSDATLNSLYAVNSITASIFSGSFTGSLEGTASWARNAITASYALNASGGGLSALYIQDEGITQGTASYINFTGTGVTATVSNSTASINITGGGGGGGALTYHQTSSAVTWNVSHSFNTYTPIVQVYDNDYNQLVPSSVSGSSLTTVQITFATATAGYAVITTGGLTITGSNAFLFQSTPATTWSFYHGLNETYPVFTIFDSNDDVIVPLRIHAENANTASIYFSTARTGTAVAANCGLSGSTFESASWAAYAVSSSYAANADLLDGKDSTVFAITGSNIFKGSQTIHGNLFMSGSFPLVYNNDSTNNMLFGMFDGSSIYGPYYQLFGNQYPNIIQRGGAEFVYDIRNNPNADFHIASFNGSTWTTKFVVNDSGSQITGSLIVTNGITGSLFGTASWALNAISSSYAVTSSYTLNASSSQNAEDIIVYVQNNSGAQINKGSVVRISGAVGDNPQISLADWTNDSNSANTLGLVMSNIPNGGNGYVMTEGRFIGYDTSTPGWSAGQLVFLGPSGSITGSAPQAPLHGVRLGQVLRVQQNNGSIYIRVDNGYELGELHDVRDTSTTASFGDLLVKSGSIWTNSRQLTGSYGLTGSLNATSITSSLFGTSSWAVSAISSSYPVAVTGNILYTPLGGTSPATFATGGSQATIILGYQAGLNTTGSSNEGEGSMYIGAYAGKDSYNNYSTIFIGEGAGERSTFNAFSTTIGAYAGYLSTASYESVVIGYNAGFRNEDSYFTTIVGEDAGYRIKASPGATILGNGGGSSILSSSYSTIVGYSAGPYMENSQGSIFIGPWSGEYSMSGSYSIVIGNSSGRLRDFSGNRTLGRNNIIIGTNIALTPGTSNGVNIGGLIFGSGSAYQNMNSNGSGYTGNASSFTGSANGRIGINQPTPLYSLDVSGSGNYTNGLTVTGSFTVITGSAIEFQVTNTGVRIGNTTTDVHTVTGSFQTTSVTGSLQVTGNSTYSGSQTFTNGFIVLTQVSQSLDFINDAAAAAGGVPLGGLYRNGNFIAIRIS